MLTHGGGGGSHRRTRYNTQTHAAVSPAATQLIQFLTTISSPHPGLHGLPIPGGITQRRWALTSSAVGTEPAAGAEAGGTRTAQREKSERRIY